MTVQVFSDDRLYPNSGLWKVHRELVKRKPDHIAISNLKVRGSYGSPLSCLRVAQALQEQRSEGGVFWSPAFVPPAYASVPTIVTVHDLTHLHYYSLLHREYYNHVLRHLYKKCAAIVCVSEATKREFCEWSGIDSGKVFVVLNGCDTRFAENSLSVNLGFRYVLYVGNHRPYKNIARLIEAYAVSGLRNDGVHLVLTGAEDVEFSRQTRSLGLRELVHFIGAWPESGIPALYRGAEACCYVSLYEGFGLPILEAMASDVPVITSNLTSMPEVAGDAALVVDPLNTHDIAAALRKAVFDHELRTKLICAGRDRIKQFDWDDSAEKLWSLVEAVANN